MLSKAAAAAAGLALLVSQVDFNSIDIAKQVQGLITPASSIVSLLQPVKVEPKPEIRLASSYSLEDTPYQSEVKEDTFCSTYIDYCKKFKSEKQGGE